MFSDLFKIRFDIAVNVFGDLFTQIDDAFTLNGVPYRITDGDGTQSIMGVCKDLVVAGGIYAQEQIFLNDTVASAVSADTVRYPMGFSGTEDGIVMLVGQYILDL